MVRKRGSHGGDLQTTAFVHAHRSSWHSQDIVEDLHNLQWDKVQGYLPLSMGYFESYGPWFMSYPASPEKHLSEPVADVMPEEGLKGHEVGSSCPFLLGVHQADKIFYGTLQLGCLQLISFS